MLREYAVLLFRQYDRDGSETLQSKEFANILGKLGHSVSDEQAMAFMSKIDSDKSGSLDLDEFLVLFIPKSSENDLLTSKVEPPCISCSVTLGNNGLKDIEFEMARLEFMFTEQSFQMLIALNNILSLKRYKESTNNRQDSALSNSAAAVVKKMRQPLTALRQELLLFCNRAEKSQTTETINIRVHGFELGFTLETNSFACNCLFVRSGHLNYSFKSKTDTNVENWHFRTMDCEIIASEPHLDPALKMDKILHPTELEISRLGSKFKFRGEESFVDIICSFWRLDFKLSQIVFLSRLAKAYLNLEKEISQNVVNEKNVIRANLKIRNEHNLPPKGTPTSSLDETQIVQWRMKLLGVNLQILDDIDCDAAPILQLQMYINDFNKILNSMEESTQISFRAESHVVIMNQCLQEWEPLVENWSLCFEILTKLDSKTQLLTIDAEETLQISIKPEHIRTLCSLSQKYVEAFARLFPAENIPLSNVSEVKAHSDLRLLSEILEITTSEFGLRNDSCFTLVVELYCGSDIVWTNTVPNGAILQVPQSKFPRAAMRIKPESFSVAGWSDLISIDWIWNDKVGSDGSNCRQSVANCRGDCNVLNFQIQVGKGFVQIVIPWKLSNLLPYDIGVTLWSKSRTYPAYDQESIHVESKSSAVDLLPFNLELLSSFRLNFYDLDFSMQKEELSYDIDTSAIRREIALKDSYGATVTIHVELNHKISMDAMLIIYPQMVLVNWTGLNLDWGRCRDLAKQKAFLGYRQIFHQRNESEKASTIQVVRAAGREKVFPLHALSPRQEVDTEPLGRALSSGIEIPCPWNLNSPSALIFSCPRGPEWDPCVSIPGSNIWERISDDFETKGDSSLREGAVLQQLSVINLQSCCSIGTSVTKENSELSFELGVDIGRGSPPYHRSLYLHLMPRLTLVNDTGMILQVFELSQNNFFRSSGCY